MYKKTSTSVLMAFMINGNKMRLEMKNRSQRYYINRPRPKHGPKYITRFFFYKQSIFDPRPENCLSFSQKSPQKIV